LKISWRGAAVAILLGMATIGASGCGPRSAPAAQAGDIGGAFHLTDTTGRRVDERVLKGKWSAVFFGYTYCPDVCPTTLTMLGHALPLLGDKKRQVQVVFITVDPARDTTAQLKQYLSAGSFPQGIVGLTGSDADIAAVARAYRVYYRKVPDGASYSMDHTGVIYLMDPAGRFAGPIDPSQTPAAVAAAIAKFMAAG